jgi:hypothetical protein
LSGRELFTFNPDMAAHDDENAADNTDYVRAESDHEGHHFFVPFIRDI